MCLLCQLIELPPWLDRLWLELCKELGCLEWAMQTENSSNISDIQKLKQENTVVKVSKFLN